MRNPFRCFNGSPEVIRLTVMMYIRYPLSLRQVEDLLFERGIDICHETVRFPCPSGLTALPWLTSESKCPLSPSYSRLGVNWVVSVD